MAASYPYVNAPGPLVSLLEKLRTAFPQNVTVETLKKLGLASQNESYIINTLQFIGVINSEGQKVAEKTKSFVADDKVYGPAIEEMVRDSYKDLFETHGEAAWDLPKPDLITFFRMSDATSEIVGGRQASTFEVLASQAGKREPQVGGASSSGTKRSPQRASGGKKVASKQKPPKGKSGGQESVELPSGGLDLGVSIRIELNLPSTDDPAVYEALFKSLREQIIDPHRDR